MKIVPLHNTPRRRKEYPFSPFVSALGGSLESFGGGVLFKSMSSVVTGTRTNTVVPFPSGIQNGDLLVLAFYIETQAPTPPAGFNPFTNLGPLAFPVSTTNLWVWRKVASGEAGDYTITHLNAPTNAVMLVYPNVNNVTPEDVAPSTNTGNNDPVFVANSINVVTPKSRVIYISAAFNADVNGINPPADNNPTFTERFDSRTAGGDKWGLHICDGRKIAAGNTGNKSVSGGAIVNDWVTTLIALRPQV